MIRNSVNALLGVLIMAGSATAQPSMQVIPRLPSWALGYFARPESINPVISPKASSVFTDPMSKKPVAWEANFTFNPAAALKNGKIVVLYRSEDRQGEGIGGHTSRLGYAESADGTTMQRRPQPVLYPADDSQKEGEWPGGCEDPRVAVTEDGTYVMMYTQWNRKLPRIGVATSKDLIRWQKHGPAFKKAYGGKFYNMATKSASVLTKLSGDRLVMTKINGAYWMYWGEDNVYGATSTDLVNWTPVVESDGSLKKLMSPRKNYFDSHLTECGPPAVLTSQGIVLLYNGKNRPAGPDCDTSYTPNSYCAGQALFDPKDPSKFVDRLDKPFLVPTASFEKSGQYPAGTVFIEGLVYFKKKWFLYYGCADSRVAVAVYDPARKSGPGLRD